MLGSIYHDSREFRDQEFGYENTDYDRRSNNQACVSRRSSGPCGLCHRAGAACWEVNRHRRPLPRRASLAPSSTGCASGALPFACLPQPARHRAAENKPTRPNIILIVADDMGFSDLGCYGGEIQTPNLDRLAAAGLRFSQCYNCAECGPSRASLMTGLYPHQVGVFEWTGLLNNRCVTAFELLSGAATRPSATGRLDMVTAENWHDPAMIARYRGSFSRQHRTPRAGPLFCGRSPDSSLSRRPTFHFAPKHLQD